MKQWTGVLLLLTVLAGGCSLTDDGTDITEPAAGPRLLISGTNVGLLSDPAANDWSPVMQTVNGKRYLYFLSDREYSGSNFFDETIYTSSNLIGIFRAEMVETSGVFSNLECLYAFDQDVQVKNIVITKFAEMNSNYADIFATYREIPTGPNIVSRIYWGENATDKELQTALSSLEQVQLSGYAELSTNGTTTNTYIFVSYLSNIPSVGKIRVLKPFIVPEYTYDDLTPDPVAAFPFDFVVKNKLFINGQIDDAWPVVLPSFRNPGKTVFGFVFSYGGVLCFDININKRHMGDFLTISKSLLEMIDAASGALGNERVLPLFWISHYPGTIDRNPSIDPETGLYFASNRAGKGFFNLYFVSKEVLYVPESVVVPDEQGI